MTTDISFVQLLKSDDGNDRITIGSGGAFAIRSGGGDDVLNLIDGHAVIIETGSGNDTVTLGDQFASFVVLGDGDDTISVAAGTFFYGVEIQGGAGIDTINLARFGAAVTVTLNESGWQTPTGVGQAGYIALIQIENIIGTEFRDRLIGNESANVISGGKGRDIITGLGGDDRLIGGLGNDLLRGGARADTFVMALGDGTDQIEDFVIGEDRIEIIEASDLSDLSFATTASGVRITFGNLVLNVDAVALGDLQNADNFIF